MIKKFSNIKKVKLFAWHMFSIVIVMSLYCSWTGCFRGGDPSFTTLLVLSLQLFCNFLGI